MQLKELATKLGIEEYPEEFEKIYKELDGNNTAFFNKAEFDKLEAEYGILEGTFQPGSIHEIPLQSPPGYYSKGRVGLQAFSDTVGRQNKIPESLALYANAEYNGSRGELYGTPAT